MTKPLEFKDGFEPFGTDWQANTMAEASENGISSTHVQGSTATATR